MITVFIDLAFEIFLLVACTSVVFIIYNSVENVFGIFAIIFGGIAIFGWAISILKRYPSRIAKKLTVSDYPEKLDAPKNTKDLGQDPW